MAGEFASAVRSLFAEALGVDEVGDRDDFFALGGTSLTAMVLAARIQDRFGVPYDLPAILEGPTPHRIAAAVERLGGSIAVPAPAAVAVPNVAIAPASAVTDFETSDRGTPLSSMERRLWYLHSLAPESPVYNEPFLFRLRGPVSVEEMERAVASVVDRHPVLRSRYVARNGEPRRIVRDDPEGAPALRVEREAVEPIQAAEHEARRPFDLARDAPFRATYFAAGEGHEYLLLTFHHIVLDEWFLSILLEDLSDAYNGAGPAPHGASYDEFVAWESERLQSESAREDEAFWRRLLEDAPHDALPLDGPRPIRSTFTGGRIVCAIPRDLSKRLRTLARRAGATPYAAWLALFAAFLSRYSGQSDLFVGVPLSLRGAARFHRTGGFFVNTLPVRLTIAPETPFASLLENARRRLMECLRHGAAPFDAIARQRQTPHEHRHVSLIQTALVVLDEHPPLPAFANISAEAVPLETGAAKFDLTLYVRDGANGAELEFEFADDAFQRETAENMAGRFADFLLAALEEPERSLASLSLMNERERRRVVHDFNQTAAAYPADATIHRLFEAQALETPGSEALVDGETAYSYCALNAAADRLAAALRRRGVVAGDKVGVMGERSAPFVIAILGVLKAGAAYVPLDPAYPAARLRHMAEDCALRLILTNGAPMPRELAAVAAPLDWNGPFDEVPGAERPADSVSPDDSAYVMYTSGSTGTPKGVDVCHRGVVRLVRGVDYARMGPGERHLLLASPAFDASTFEIWGPLLNGGVCVAHRNAHIDLKTFGAELREKRITCLWLTSTLFNTVIDYDPGALRSVGQLLIGGEALSPDHVRRALAALPDTRITNGYGPTECTTFACTWPIPAGLDERTGSIPIGRPIANTRAYVLDDSGEPAPVGVFGELYLGGDGLARGYLNMPEATAERFVIDPFVSAPGARMYRTGDRCRWRSDGALEFGGRIDGQVKVRGFRIELGEIEAVLSRHPSVAQCVVALRNDGAGDALAAYVVGRNGVTADMLRAHIAASLPPHMAPSFITFMDALPVTANGKTDRRALPPPRRRTAPPADPASPLETDVLRIFREVLNRPDAGVSDDFFALGGDSLTALRLVAAVNRAMGAGLDVPSFFAAATAAGVALTLTEAMRPEGPIRAVSLREGLAPAFFCVWGLGMFRALAERLPADRAVCGLYGDEELGRSDGDGDLAALAGRYVAAMRALQPNGPYRIGGHSFGGLIAFEMARQLTEAGEEPPLLALFDSIWTEAIRIRKRKRALYHLGELRVRGVAHVAGMFRKLQSASTPNRRRVSQVERYLASYRPIPYRGAAVLFRAEETLRHPYMDIAGDFGWAKLIRGAFAIHDVPGGHMTMFGEPYIDALAAAVTPYLDA